MVLFGNLPVKAQAAGVTVEWSASDPGVKESEVADVDRKVESFNSLTAGNLEDGESLQVGTAQVSGTVRVLSPGSPDYGGTGTNFLAVSPGGEIDITLNTSSKYVGFFWGAGGDGNTVEVFLTGSSEPDATFDSTTITGLSEEYDGQGKPWCTGCADEPYAYINLQLDDPTKTFARLRFSAEVGQGGFELDNLTTSTVWGGAGSTGQLAVTTEPAINAFGTVLSTAPVVELRDDNGNLEASANDVVTATLVGTGGTLSGTTSVAAVNGVATFTDLTISGSTGTAYRLDFSSGMRSTASSRSLTLYQLSYDANEDQHQAGVVTGSTPSSTSAMAGSTVDIAGNTGTLVRQGFVFDGWNTADDGSGDSYEAADTITLDSDQTLYAQWRIPEAARLFGLTDGGERRETIVPIVDGNGDSVSGNIRGITTDGQSVYFMPHNQGANAGVIREVSFDGELIEDHSVTGAGSNFQGTMLEKRDLTYSSGCIFIRQDGGLNSKLYCIDTTTWSMSEVSVPTENPPGGSTPVGLLPGNIWLDGNLIDFPDGRIGAVSKANWSTSFTATGLGTINMPRGTGPGECPTGFHCKILRLYEVDGTGSAVTLTFSEDIVLADQESGWPSDDHGIATDGTYLYQSHHNNGYKTFGLRSGAPSYVVFDGDGASGPCEANDGVSGSLCAINGWSKGDLSVANATFFARDHVNKRYLMGDYENPHFITTIAATDQPAGVGTIDAPSAPRSVQGTAGNQQVSVSWQAPTSDGGGAIVSYTVTASPGGATCTTSGLSCVVTGLTNGTAYTFSVYATNNGGNSQTQTSTAVTPAIPQSSPSGNSSNRTPRENVVPPAVPTTPQSTPRLPLPPRPSSTPQALNGPVNNGGSNSPPNQPRATIGGVPAPVTTLQSGANAVQVQTGGVRLGVALSRGTVPGGGVANNPQTNQPELTVPSGGSTTIQGGGLRPGTVVQVWLPGMSPSELARVPVGDDGSFSSELRLGASAGQSPLPIGRQVLQVTGFDENGNQTVVDMPVNIAQGPPTPEQNRSQGALPDLSPGQSLATSAGLPTEVRVSALTEQRTVLVEAGDWALSVAVDGDGGLVESSGNQPVIRMTQSGTGSVSGQGFLPGTMASIWFFSEPTLMATVTVADDGSIDASFLVDSQFIPVGDHTLQIQGVGTDGFIKAANLGVLVDSPGLATTAESASSLLWWVLAAIVGIVLLAFLLLLRRRRVA